MLDTERSLVVATIQVNVDTSTTLPVDLASAYNIILDGRP